jgi:hypothetical protein
VEQMLNSETSFGFTRSYQHLFSDTSETMDSAIIKDAVECPDVDTCSIWASIYQNISTILFDMHMGIFRRNEKLIDENNKPLLCELEDGVIRTFAFTISVRKRSYYFDFMNDVIDRIVEGGIFMHIKKNLFEKEEIQVEFNIHTSDDEYFIFGVSHLLTAFYLLMLGYVLAVVCFVIEILWHRYRSKGHKQTCTSVRHK